MRWGTGFALGVYATALSAAHVLGQSGLPSLVGYDRELTPCTHGVLVVTALLFAAHMVVTGRRREGGRTVMAGFLVAMMPMGVAFIRYGLPDLDHAFFQLSVGAVWGIPFAVLVGLTATASAQRPAFATLAAWGWAFSALSWIVYFLLVASGFGTQVRVTVALALGACSAVALLASWGGYAQSTERRQRAWFAVCGALGVLEAALLAG
ncbi:MAG: hypothetical protein AB2A00_03605 [Myxococcota bacterium]